MKILSIVLFAFYFQANKTEDIDYRENFIRLEIDMGVYQSLKVFEEGILCKSVDSNMMFIFEFYPLKDLDFYKFIKLQDYLSENDLFGMDSLYFDSRKREYSTFGIHFFAIKNDLFKKIMWKNGANRQLEKIVDLVNDLIPEQQRLLYEIKPTWIR